VAEERTRDFWEKAPIFVTFFQAVVIGAVGLFVNLSFQNQQEQSRRAQTATQIMSQREQSEMDFRGKMFVALVAKLLNHSAPLDERLATLSLFQDNFHDTFNGRAFFDVLAKEARRKHDPAALQDLSTLAHRISQIQESVIASNGGFQAETEWIKEKTTVPVDLGAHDEEDHHAGHAEAEEGRHIGHSVTLTLLQVKGDDTIEVSLQTGHSGEAENEPFEVSRYDTPFTDNLLLRDGDRVAVLLKGIRAKEHQAKLKLVHFPADYILTGYRPSLGQLGRMLEGMH